MNLIFETLAGSHLYGTNTPESDIDYRGVVIPPRNIRDDPFTNFEQQEFPGEDKVHYGLKKFFQLASDCNPNIIELFYAPDNCITVNTPEWSLISGSANNFLSTKARFTFTGYALSQLKRIKLHRSWLLNPPNHKPTREEFGLGNVPEFGLEVMTNLIYAPEEYIIPEYRQIALAEKSYRSAKEYWNNYESWRNTRNEKRFALEEKFGYDTKHGMHLYRLLTEGTELLENGTITLPRPDAKFLLEIRNGALSYDELIQTVGNFQEKIDSINSPLPKHPNRKAISELYQELTKD